MSDRSYLTDHELTNDLLGEIRGEIRDLRRSIDALVRVQHSSLKVSILLRCGATGVGQEELRNTPFSILDEAKGDEE